MAENNDPHDKKKSLLEIANETIQWLIFGSILSKKGGEGQKLGPDGKPEIEIPNVPSWAMNLFHFLTTEDEQEYNQILDRFSNNPEEQMLFFKFKNRLIKDGYDEDHLRLMLVNLNRDWINRKDAKKTDIPNSAVNLITDIVLLNGSYSKQKKLAEEKKFLKKTSLGKRSFLFVSKNKTVVLIWTLCGIFGILALTKFILS